MPDSAKPQVRNKRDRKATEAAIVAAFEAVLLREGVQGLGINAVAQEAGVNKVLIYRYFHDFTGLARHWVNNGSFWPDAIELIGGDPEAFEKLELDERICVVLDNYIGAIRARPLTVEILASEITKPNELTRTLVEGMVQFGKGVGDYIKQETDDRDRSDKIWALIYLVTAVTTFFAVRERYNPRFLGLDLSEDESWEFMRKAIAEMAAKYLKD